MSQFKTVPGSHPVFYWEILLIADLAAKLSKDYPDAKQIDELRSALEYRFDEETGLFTPILFVYTMQNGAPSDDSFRYSLTKGLWAPTKYSDADLIEVE